MEAATTELKALKTTVSELRQAVEAAEESRDTEACRILSERVTQALVAVDGVEVSKSAAAQALRDSDRKTAMAMSVLIARRKAVVKSLNEIGDRVDLILAGEKSTEAVVAAQEPETEDVSA